MRLFVAIDCGQADFSQLQQGFRPCLHASWPRSFHLTLKFLGEVADARPVKQAIQALEFSAFTLTTTGFGVFPNQRAPRVLWVGAEPAGTLHGLHRKIDTSLSRFQPDTRFHPHITLARIKRVQDRQAFDRLLARPPPQLTVPVRAIELIQSQLTPEGPAYTVLAKAQAKDI